MQAEKQRRERKGNAAVSDSADARPKRVTYKDQREKHERKAQRRQKHTRDAFKLLKELIETKGVEDAQTIEALEIYVEKSIEAAQYMLDKGEHEDAGRTLEDCARVLKTEVRASFPHLLFKIQYRQAELQNARGLHQESLVYLRQAIVSAEEQNAVSDNALACLPAETYLNTAIALQYAERLGEAIDAADKASKASQRAIIALSEVQQQPKAFRQLSVQEAQDQLMVQMDIQIQTHLVQGQILEKMSKFEEASRVLQTGKRLLELNFGAQHPLMSEFAQAEQSITMQVVPDAVDPRAGPVSGTGEAIDTKIELGKENIAALLDKRSELMKRGRVKRIYYELTEAVQVRDMRSEFADLEELEEKQAAEVNSCAQTQQSWMQRQQLMAMRQQQDEQFRMMELLISTKRREQAVCQHPQVYLPYQFSYPVVQQPPVETQESSSEPSESTEEEIVREPSPIPSYPTPTPREEPEPAESSVSSKSDSYECQSQNFGEMENFKSEDSDSDVEEPPAFIDRQYDPLVIEERKPVRSSGREFTFKEKNFKSGIYLTKRKLASEKAQSDKPDQPEDPQPHTLVVDREWIELTLIIKIQARVRRFLRLRRRRNDNHFGEVCPIFYIKSNQYQFKITIYKVQVAHTITRKRTRVEKTHMRHHYEDQMQQVEQKVQEVAPEKHTRMVIMYQVILECINEEAQLGSAQKLIPLIEFPAEFPYLIDYMRLALTIEIVKHKSANFKVEFKKLSWSREQEILMSIKQMIMNLDNSRHRAYAFGPSDDGSGYSIGMDAQATSFKSRIDEIDYDAIRGKIEEAQSQGHDMEALRLKIQWEARQLLERQQITSTEVCKIVHRDVRKERQWRDHIHINDFRQVDANKITVKPRPNLAAIVKVQALIRGFLARRSKPRGPTWQLLFDFVVSQGGNYYLVRAYKAPESLYEQLSEPFQVVVTRYMQPQDSYKMRMAELPYAGENCRQDMIESIQITQESSCFGNIQEVSFKPLGQRVKVVVPLDSAKGRPAPAKKPPVETVEKKPLIEEELRDEFITDWEMPAEESKGRFEIRKFTMYPALIITFGLEQSDVHSFFYVNVLYVPRPSSPQESEVRFHKLPVALDCMVYFLRRYLKVYFEAKEKLHYAAIQNFPGKQAFEWEMNVLHKKLKKDTKLEARLQIVLKQQVINKRNDIEAAALNQYEVAMHGNLYIVKIIHGPDQLEKQLDEAEPSKGSRSSSSSSSSSSSDAGKKKKKKSKKDKKAKKNMKDKKDQLIKEQSEANKKMSSSRFSKDEVYRIFVYRKDDPDDAHYISVLSEEFYSREAMFQNIREHLKIYIDSQTNMIRYAALNKARHAPVKPLPAQIDLYLIIKVQARIRGWLARRRFKREFEGQVTTFIMKDEEIPGRKVRITVWKTIVEHTKKKKITQKVRERDSRGNVRSEEVKQAGDEQVVKEQIEAYQIVAKNFYLDENHHEKIIIKLPPRDIMIEALREAIQLKWRGSFDHEIEGLQVDWLESISYKKLDDELLKRAYKNTKEMLQSKDLSRYNIKIGFESSWNEQISYGVGEHMIRLLEVTEPTDLDSQMVKILAYAKNAQGQANERELAAQTVLTVREALALMKKRLSEEQMASMLIEDIYQLVSYGQKHADWDLLLRECCSVLSTGAIFIDEMIFQSKRYSFDPSQVRGDVKAINAVKLMQKYIRKYLQKKRHQKLMRTPGYATATGVFIEKDIYLVYLLAASRDQKSFRLTLKQRLPDARRAPILEKHLISDAVAQQAMLQYPNMFNLQSVTRMFEEKILKSRAKAILTDGYGGTNANWREDLITIIQQDF